MSANRGLGTATSRILVSVTRPPVLRLVTVMAARICVGMATLVLMASCQLPGSQPSCSTVAIDWVNFVQVGPVQYVAGPASPTAIAESDLGPEFAKVKFKVDGNICDPSYRIKDGDAAFLEAGTPIYQVKGHLPAEQLAARMNGTILVYRAQTLAS
jgi:hypothetical protein